MADIDRPTEDGSDRHGACEAALKSAFEELISEAMGAGWQEGEACDALANLADRHIIALYEPLATAEIHKIPRKKH